MAKPDPTANQPFAFCEPVWAGSASRWHIRPLTGQGRKESGGADTLALCGEKVSWDLGPANVEATLEHTYPGAPPLEEDFCTSCLNGYRKLPPRARTL